MRRGGSGNSPLISEKAPLLCYACLLARSPSPIRVQIVAIKKTHLRVMWESNPGLPSITPVSMLL